MKILILGHGEHGKDEAAKIISNLTGLSFTSSSLAMLDEIYPALNAAATSFSDRIFIDGVRQPYYENKTEAFNDRRNCRAVWKALIDLYNTPDKASLARLITSKTDIYVGMRDDVEFEASKYLFDFVFWIDRSQHLPTDNTMVIRYDESMIWIDNNGDLEDLRVTLNDHIFNLGL